MKVTISVGGRWHAFYLAQQLLKQGFLNKLITSYPKYEVVKYGIPKDKIKSVVIKELMDRGWGRLPLFLRNSYNPQYLIHEVFDRWASCLYSKSDICVAWSSFGLHTIRKAKDIGAITLITRGNSHMLHQTEILKEEYARLCLQPKVAHPKIIEKELKEYKEADYIVIPSLFVKRTFLEKGVPEGKLIHVPYGVHTDEFRRIPKEDDVFRVIYVGPMNIRKGVHYLLQAFSELKLPNSELLLVGGMAEEAKPFFKKFEGSYKWIGHVPQKELFKYYSQGSVFVLMSIEDGFGVVLTQAMGCSLPVVCTTNTGGMDIVRDGVDGFIIPIRDVGALKEKLVYLYDNPNIVEAMGQSARERVSKRFTWDDYGERMTKEYKRILNARNTLL